MQKPNRGEDRSLSKSERQKLQGLYTHGAAAYGPVRNLSKASNLSVAKVRKVSQSKTSYTNITLATRKFKKRKAFARFKKEIWYTGFAFVHELAKGNNGVKQLLVRQDLFQRKIDAKGMKTNVSKETVRAFSTMITKMKRP